MKIDKSKKQIQAFEKKQKQLRGLIREYMEAKDAAEQPTPEERKQKELSELYDDFFRKFDKLSAYSELLWELSKESEGGTAIPITSLHVVINDLGVAMCKAGDIAARVFALIGIVKEQTEGVESIEDLLPVKNGETE